MLTGGGMTLLTIVFLLLKVFGYIDWAWIWIFAPLWIPLGLTLFILLVVGIVAIVVAIKEK